jgi:DNA topoisomerase-1
VVQGKRATRDADMSALSIATANGSLTFVNDSAPGFTRRRAGRGFCFFGVDGKRIVDPKTLARIRKLAIPPAWKHVWICPDARGHIQAVGWDARGRKQYRYHDHWREERDREKFARLSDFGEVLPSIRKTVAAELSSRTMTRTYVLAGVVSILDRTLMRVSNERYVEQNGSFGLTTLRNKHFSISNRRLVFSYPGKERRASPECRDRPEARHAGSEMPRAPRSGSVPMDRRGWSSASDRLE